MAQVYSIRFCSLEICEPCELVFPSLSALQSSRCIELSLGNKKIIPKCSGKVHLHTKHTLLYMGGLKGYDVWVTMQLNVPYNQLGCFNQTKRSIILDVLSQDTSLVVSINDPLSTTASICHHNNQRSLIQTLDGVPYFTVAVVADFTPSFPVEMRNSTPNSSLV